MYLLGAIYAPFFLPEGFTVTAPKMTPRERKAAKVLADAKRRRFTPEQWSRIEAMWASGSVTYADLIAKFGSCTATFERHFKRVGCVKGSNAAATKERIVAKLESTAIAEATVLAARIHETKEQHYTMVGNLAKLAWNEILQCKRDNLPVSVAAANLKALNEGMTIFKKVREEKWAILGLDRPDAIDPDEIPELIISELTAEEVQQLRDRDHSELDDITPPPAGEGDEDDGEGDDEDVDDSDGVVEEG